jgi:hypothetical protein
MNYLAEAIDDAHEEFWVNNRKTLRRMLAADGGDAYPA